MSLAAADAVDVGACLTLAHELADLADALTAPAFAGARFDVDRKADGTAVTEIDTGTERRLRERIAERFPDHAVLGEEDGWQGPADAPCWVLDPIDGTTNFIKGNPIWATLIACRVGDDEVVGVVSAPALASRWDGRLDGAARRDGREIRVSEVARLEEAEVSLGGLGYFHREGLGGLVAELARRTRRQRGYGDFLQHCLVASGATDAALEAEVNLWDLAAVRCVVRAAGGRLTALDGREGAGHGTALATNGRLHDQLLALVADHREP